MSSPRGSARMAGSDASGPIGSGMVETDREGAAASAHSGEAALDDVLDRLRFGKFHWFLFAVLGTANLAEGAEILVLALTARALETQMGLSATLRGILASSTFVGMILGTLLVGPIGDRHGRRTALLLFTVVLACAGLACAGAPDYNSLVALRVLVGVGIGGVLPISHAILIEFCPTERRGFIMLLYGVYFPLGEVLAVAAAWLMMPEVDQGNWRLLLGAVSAPVFLFLILCYWWLPESPRFWVEVGDAQKVEETIELMCRTNGDPVPDMTELRRACEQAAHRQRAGGADAPALGDRRGSSEPPLGDHPAHPQPAARGTWAVLFSRALWLTTTLVWLNWFLQATAYNGLLYYLPSLFAKDEALDARGHRQPDGDAVYIDILLSALAEVPGIFLPMWMVDVQWLGRRGSLWVLQLLGGSACVAAFAIRDDTVLVASACVAKLALSASFNVLYLYTCEVFPTRVRSTGAGFVNTGSTIAGLAAPLATELIIARSSLLMLPFLVFGSALFIGVLAACALPIETMGTSLSHVGEGKAELAAESPGIASAGRSEKQASGGEGSDTDEHEREALLSESSPLV